MAPKSKPVDYRKIENTQERRANLIVDMLEDKAQRIADYFDEPPPGTQEPSPAQIREMWTFSPFGPPHVADPILWALHDQALATLLDQIASQPNMPGDQRMQLLRKAHQQAEMFALGKVYPQRAELILLGITTPERSVQLAERARRLVEQDAKRNPPQPQQPQEVTAYG